MNANSCPLCGALGTRSSRQCVSCHGTPQAMLLAGRVLYWGARVDRFGNRLAGAEFWIKSGINFFLVLFGVSGFAALFYSVRYNPEIIFSSLFWQRPSLWLAFFWFTMWGDLYLWYRISREAERAPPVMKKKYAGGVTKLVSASWQETENIKKSAWLDVSHSYTLRAMGAVRKSYEIARGHGAAEVDLIHLFAGLLTTQEVAVIFGRLSLRVSDLKERVERALAATRSDSNEAWFTASAITALYVAYAESYRERRKFVDPTILLLAVIRAGGTPAEILYDLEVDERKVANVVAWLALDAELRERYRKGRTLWRRRPTHEAGRTMTSIATPYLDQFSEDVTLAARYGRVPSIVGRGKEIEAVFRILEGGGVSVVLVGSPGVGKDAIVEGIALRMVEEDVPKILSDKRMVTLSIPKLVSGKSATESAERLYRIFYEVSRAKNVILHIPNIHELAGIAVGAPGSLDLAGVLAAELEKRYFLAICSTNLSGYRTLEKSPLGNILQKVEVGEPEVDDTIRILESKAGLIEYKNRVFFSYDAIEKAAVFSNQYLPDRFLPEKAIEILKEAAHATRSKKGQKAIITGEDVAEIISEKSHVPVTKVTKAEAEKLLELEARMAERIVGQKEAVKAVASAIRRARAGLRSGNRPIANFLFLGPTGVGKTETAKTVAEVYFGNEENMIRLDMSEYQDQASLYRMIGEPGGSGGGLLTEEVRKQPFTLLLLDEIEKAHPDILNIFLQVMDDGRLTDNEGRTVDFTNVILIATSNAGTQVIQDEIKKGTVLAEIKNFLINKELRNYFRPEFLNRFDGIIVFTPLSEEEIRQVARLMLLAVAKQLEEKGVALRVTDEAVVELATAGFDPVFGARPLRRVIQEKVQDALANFLLQNKLGRRDVVALEAGGIIKIEKAEQL